MTRCAKCGHELVTDRLVSPTCGKAPCPCITDEDEACDPAIPASRVRALAWRWTSTRKSQDAYRDGYDDARNECADALDALIREYAEPDAIRRGEVEP